MSCSMAIMQPYVFPYIGYFQLVHAVDTFVFFDDVNFMKKGWVNRNKLLLNGEEYYFSIPLKGASQNKLICDISLLMDEKWERRFLATIEQNYGKAPYFDMVFPLVEKIIKAQHGSIATLAMESVKEVANYLGISTIFEVSSEKYGATRGMNKADRLIAICHQKSCEKYINPSGGKDLYEKVYFSERGMQLYFIENELLPYEQFQNVGIIGLSIIDVLMFNSKEATLHLTEQYKLT